MTTYYSARPSQIAQLGLYGLTSLGSALWSLAQQGTRDAVKGYFAGPSHPPVARTAVTHTSSYYSPKNSTVYAPTYKSYNRVSRSVRSYYKPRYIKYRFKKSRYRGRYRRRYY